MGRNRKKSGAGAVEAKTYDIFGNVTGETAEPAPIQPQSVPEAPVEVPAPATSFTNSGAQAVVGLLNKINQGVVPQVSITDESFNGISVEERQRVSGLINDALDQIYDQMANFFLDAVDLRTRGFTNQSPEWKRAKKNMKAIAALAKMIGAIEHQRITENQPLMGRPSLRRTVESELDSMIDGLNAVLNIAVREASVNNDPRLPDYLNVNSSSSIVSGGGGRPMTRRQYIANFIDDLM